MRHKFHSLVYMSSKRMQCTLQRSRPGGRSTVVMQVSNVRSCYLCAVRTIYSDIFLVSVAQFLYWYLVQIFDTRSFVPPGGSSQMSHNAESCEIEDVSIACRLALTI